MIYPIEGYRIICDECGDEISFFENTDYFNSLEIDNHFWDNYIENLKKEGWKIEEEEILCPKCNKKRR